MPAGFSRQGHQLYSYGLSKNTASLCHPGGINCFRSETAASRPADGGSDKKERWFDAGIKNTVDWNRP
jgi:hypothetical protein